MRRLAVVISFSPRPTLKQHCWSDDVFSTALLRRIGQGPAKGEKEIKLLYVTPEKIVKSKTLTNALQKAYDDSRLARIAM